MKHVPQHRAAPKRPAVAEVLEKTPRRIVTSTVLLGSLAVGATGVLVGTGVAAGPSADSAHAADPERGVATAEALADLAAVDTDSSTDSDTGGAASAAADEVASSPNRRAPTLSRSADRRDRTDPLKEAVLSAEPAGEVESGSRSLSDADPRDIAMALLGDFGFSSDQFGCLDALYVRESGWDPFADNPTSSAYGIPQALPGSRMASAGADWATNPVTQIRWGLGYIAERYGSPCSALAFSDSNGYY